MRLPQAGDNFRDNEGRIHTITKIATMYEKLCIVYTYGDKYGTPENHYIAIEAIHLHSSGAFWFKEPLTDSL